MHPYLPHYRPYQTTSAQVRSIAELLINALQNRGFTTFREILDANGPHFGPAQRNNVLYMLSRVSSAVGLGAVTALVEGDAPNALQGFFNEFAPDVAVADREVWIQQHRQTLYGNSAPLIRLLRFVISEVERDD